MQCAIFSSKKDGGLGLRDLTCLSLSGFLVLTWCIIVGNSIWSKFFLACHKLDSISTMYRQSLIYSILRRFFPILQEKCYQVIGRILNVNFWTNRWLDRPVINLVSSGMSRGFFLF